MKFINQLFFKGLAVVLPVTITLYLLVWVSIKAEGILGGIIRGVFGGLYIPGLGIIFGFLILVLVGFLVNNYVTGKLVNFFISKFEKVPFIKAIYSPLKDLMSLFSTGGGSDQMKKVVIFDHPLLPGKGIGLVTREEFSDFPEGAVEQGLISVYVPMSYMLGGFTVLVARDKVKQIDIPVERALKLALTGWIKVDKNQDETKN